MEKPTKENIKMVLMGLTVIIGFVHLLNSDFTPPINQELAFNHESVTKEISLPIVNVASAHDQFTVKLFGPDGNLKAIRTNG